MEKSWDKHPGSATLVKAVEDGGVYVHSYTYESRLSMFDQLVCIKYDETESWTDRDGREPPSWEICDTSHFALMV